MSLILYTIGILFATFISLGSFVAIIAYFSPQEAGMPVFIVLYLSLLIGSTGVFSLGGLYLRKVLIKDKPTFSFLRVSFRQGLLLSLILIGMLILQSFRTLNWWNGGLIVGCVVLGEVWLSR